MAHRLRGQPDRAVVAIIGDRALASGLAWEGLNHLAVADLPVIVVINDNGSSDAAATSGIGMHLRTLQAAAGRGAECHTCGAGAVAGNAFTDLGVGYLGPIDGHDVAACERALRIARELNRPVVVHCITRDGGGHRPTGNAARHRVCELAVSPAAAAQPDISRGQAWAEALAAEMCAIAAERDYLVAVTPAGPISAGLECFAQRFPERVFDVGVAAQQGVCLAAGLAVGGMRPLLALHAADLGRAFDQILSDVALPRLPVTVVLATDTFSATQGRHGYGALDLPILRALPALAVAVPRDPARLRDLLREAIDHTEGPTVLRLPVSPAAGADIDAIDESHGAEILYRSRSSRRDLLLVAVGALAAPCVEAARIIDHAGIGVTVVDPRWVIPINPVLPRLLAHHRLGVSVEDADRAAGVGALLAHTCADEGVRTPIRNLGLPPGLIAPRRDRLTGTDLSAQAIASAALRTLMATRHETPPHHTTSISSRPGS
jgi:1-deoxy-D-xylulose-5-phosphate synthase